MATRAQRQALKQAEEAIIRSMSDDDLAALVSGLPPDPEVTQALFLMSEKEVSEHIRAPRTKAQLIALVDGRTHAPAAPQHQR